MGCFYYVLKSVDFFRVFGKMKMCIKEDGERNVIKWIDRN